MSEERCLEALKNHYADDIKEAYFECEHMLGSKIDIPALNQRLASLIAAAFKEGLPMQEFDDLVRTILPDLHPKLAYRTPSGPMKKRAA